MCLHDNKVILSIAIYDNQWLGKKKRVNLYSDNLKFRKKEYDHLLRGQNGQ